MTVDIIGLITVALMVVVNIVIAAFSYGKLSKGQDTLTKQLEQHCLLNDRQFEQVNHRVERLEDNALATKKP